MKSVDDSSFNLSTVQVLSALPDTVTNVTRNRPMTSALAVVAVRLGLRIELSAASRAVSPSRRIGRIATHAKARASSGPPTSTPMKSRRIPPARIGHCTETVRV